MAKTERSGTAKTKVKKAARARLKSKTKRTDRNKRKKTSKPRRVKPRKHHTRAEIVKYLSNEAYVKEFLADIGGVKSIDVVNILKRRKEVNEFRLAERLKMEVKAVRKILYRLYTKKVVSFRKTRDEEKGWYVYVWKLEPKKIVELMGKRKTQAVTSLKEKLERETSSQFFKCVNGCMRISFEKAFELSFICPECGSRLEAFDNEAIVKQLKQYIDQVEKF